MTPMDLRSSIIILLVQLNNFSREIYCLKLTLFRPTHQNFTVDMMSLQKNKAILFASIPDSLEKLSSLLGDILGLSYREHHFK